MLATVAYRGALLDRLRGACAPAELIQVARDDDAGIRAALADAEIAILAGDLDERHLAAPRLRWIHCDHAGLNRSARPEVFERGLLVTGSAGRSGPAIAEHAFFFMLSLAYDAPGLLKAQGERRWRVPGHEQLRALRGRTVGILGLGSTGRELAVRAAAFDMRVLGYRRRVAPPPPGVERVFAADAGDGLEALLAESDFVVLALPLSDATWRRIGARELAQMKPSAFLVNVARGGLVDEAALVRALETGALAGAASDTFESEPLDPASPLWTAPGMLVTPHQTPKLPDRTERSLDIICENFRRYRSGETLRNLLTPEDVFTPRPKVRRPRGRLTRLRGWLGGSG